MEETGYTVIDWLSAGLSVCTIVISFMTYLYFKTKLKIKDLKEKNEGLVNRLSIHDNTFHELTEKYTSLNKDYKKLKEGHTIHEIRVVGAKPIGVSAKLALPDFDRHYIAEEEEELTAETKLRLAQQIGVYCMQNNYIHFEENYNPMRNSKTLAAYLSVASNNEEIIKVLRPDPLIAIDMGKVREMNSTHHIQRGRINECLSFTKRLF